MTLPVERTRAVIVTQEFLYALLDPRQTPKVPRAIRERASLCLRHYPWPHYLRESAKALPDVWGPLDAT